MPHHRPLNPQRIVRDTFVEGVYYRPSMASTSDTARELIQAAAASSQKFATPRLVVCDRQTAGRGRGSNRWWSGPGGLTFSLVLGEELRGLPTTELPKLSITAALAVLEMARQQIPADALELRWPNDVYAGGRKLSGILPEMLHVGGRDWCVLGIGVNVNQRFEEAPPEVAAIATSIGEWTAAPLSLEDVLVQLLNGLQRELLRLLRRDETLCRSWNAWFRLAGRPVSLESGGRTIRGLCRGIDEAGRLLVEQDGQRRALHAGTNVRPVDV